MTSLLGSICTETNTALFLGCLPANIRRLHVLDVATVQVDLDHGRIKFGPADFANHVEPFGDDASLSGRSHVEHACGRLAFDAIDLSHHRFARYSDGHLTVVLLFKCCVE